MLPPMLNNLSLSTEDEGALKSLLANFGNIGSLVEFIFHHSPSILHTKFFFCLILFSLSWILLYFFQNWFISSSFWVVGVCSFRFYNGIYSYLLIISYYVATWYRLGIGWKIPIPIPIPIPRISTDTDTDTWKLIWTDTDTNQYQYQGFQPIPILTEQEFQPIFTNTDTFAHL